MYPFTVKESYQFRSPGHKGKPCRNAADVSHSNAAEIKKKLSEKALQRSWCSLKMKYVHFMKDHNDIKALSFFSFKKVT